MSYTCPICGTEHENQQDSCPSCGYGAIGRTQKFKPIKLDEASGLDAITQAGKTGLLKVIRGPQIGMVYRLNNNVQTLGRSPRCDIFLNDMTVSREHAYITCSNDLCEICDNNSFNGVWVNNKSVSTKMLEPGDVIQLGVFCLVFDYE